MENNKRSCIALICAVKINKKKYTGIFDIAKKKVNLYAISVANNENIDLYDFERGSHIIGTYSNIFDGATSSYITIEFSNKSFNGFDNESQTLFTGEVTSTGVTLYDFQEDKYNYYILS